MRRNLQFLMVVLVFAAAGAYFVLRLLDRGDALRPEIGEPPALETPTEPIAVASFNIRVLSDDSRTDDELALIADRIEPYDLIAIQELRDKVVLGRLLGILSERRQVFNWLVSRPVGRGDSSMELYAFLYRPETVQALDNGTVYGDTGDVFIREPFIASFRAGRFDFTLITTHAIFGNTIAGRREEAGHLATVYEQVQSADPNEQDVLILGDFNLPPEDKGFNRLRALLTPVFTGDLRTTVADTSLYDNFWFDTRHVREFTGESGIDKFDETVFDNRDENAKRAVSDHRPVWTKFRTDLEDDDGPAL